MDRARSKTIGLRTGLIILGLAVLTGAVSLIRPQPLIYVQADALNVRPEGLETRLSDASTAAYFKRLKAVSPGGWAALEAEAVTRIRAGADEAELAELVLLSILVELKRGAGDLKLAPTAQYDRMVAHAGEALKRLQAEQSVWCEGPRLAAYLEADEDRLIPELLALYPYQSASYDWAMAFGVIGLDAIEAGRMTPQRRARPTGFEKAWLQRTGLSLGSEQWALGLQIMAFSQSEGQGYRQMQTAIAGIDACELGLAAVEVSGLLPEQIRGVIWADLLPELFHGNMPYVIWRVNDYFFLD